MASKITLNIQHFERHYYFKPRETIILKVTTSNEESTRGVYQQRMHDYLPPPISLSHVANSYRLSPRNLTIGLGNQWISYGYHEKYDELDILSI
jgi:hypothetical protein